MSSSTSNGNSNGTGTNQVPDAEGVPLLQQHQQQQESKATQQSQSQQQQRQFDVPSSVQVAMMMPPGNYGATAGNAGNHPNNSSNSSNSNNNAMAGYAMAAAQYDQYYNQDPAVAAAAAAAMQMNMMNHHQHQHQHQMNNMSNLPLQGSPNGPPPPSYYYQPYAPVPPQMQMQYMQYAAGAPPPPSRPPRHERRTSGGKSPLPSPQTMSGKTYPMPVGVGGGSLTPPPPIAVKEQVHSSIPPLQDIFSNDSSLPPSNSQQQQQQQPSNYGSINNNNNSNKVYNAPPRSSNSPNFGRGGGTGKVQPVLVRTNSAENMTTNTTTSTQFSNNNVFSNSIPATNKKKIGSSHRRSNSDTPLRALHRRMGSNDLPPKGNSSSSSGHRRTASAARARSYSANSLQNQGGGGGSGTGGGSSVKRGHRRMDSAGSVQTYSSAISQGSIISNISKSAMFGGVDEGGRVQLHFPLEAVRLRFQDDEDINNYEDEQQYYYKKKNKKNWSSSSPSSSLTRGHLYQYRNPNDYDKFEEYIRITEDLEQGLAPQWENLGITANAALKNKACNCTCNNCNGCLGKRQLLPDTNYALPVGDGVYKRVLGEIADAQTMPCGLFFCGHHEDVAYPSIGIAVVLVTIMFVALIYAAVATDLWN